MVQSRQETVYLKDADPCKRPRGVQEYSEIY